MKELVPRRGVLELLQNSALAWRGLGA